MAQDVNIFNKAIIDVLFHDPNRRGQVKAVAAILQSRLQSRSEADGKVEPLGLEELVRIGEVAALVSEHVKNGPQRAPVLDAAANLLRASGSTLNERGSYVDRQAELSGALAPHLEQVRGWVSAFVAAADQELELAAQGQSKRNFTARVV